MIYVPYICALATISIFTQDYIDEYCQANVTLTMTFDNNYYLNVSWVDLSMIRIASSSIFFFICDVQLSRFLNCFKNVVQVYLSICTLYCDLGHQL